MISVCIPTFNGENYIKEQLTSILQQLGKNDEIIISDDSSTDSTLEIIEDLKDQRIKVLKGNKFKSPIFNLENALKHAKGNYIFLSDQDDIWLEKKIETMLPYLKEYTTVVSDCQVVNNNKEVLFESFQSLNNSKRGYLSNLIKNSYLGCCMAFDRNILKRILPFPKDIAMHDIWIGLISELTGQPIFIKDKLIMYRRHGNNISTTSGKNNTSFTFKVSYRIHFLYASMLRKFNIS